MRRCVVSRAWRVGVILVLFLGCRSGAEPARETLTIAAAASLTDVFRDLEPGFEAQHPELDVQFIFAGSQVLRWQIEAGLAADVYASADPLEMQGLQESGLVSEPVSIAKNSLAVVYRQDEMGPVADLSDLLHVPAWVLGVEGSPIGRYTETLLNRVEGDIGAAFRDRIHQKVVSYEKNVRVLRSKVALGVVPAAMVYASDVTGVDELQGFILPASVQPDIRYPIAVVSSSQHPDAARLWISFVQSKTAQDRWTSHGFPAGDAP